MTHNEKRAHWVKEGLITGLSGVLYGGISCLIFYHFFLLRSRLLVTLTVVSHVSYLAHNPIVSHSFNF